MIHDILDMTILPLHVENYLYDEEWDYYPYVNSEQVLMGVMSRESMMEGSCSVTYESSLMMNHIPHWVEAVHKMNECQSNIIMICDAEDQYIGAITSQSLLRMISSSMMMESSYSILELEIDMRQLVLSELARTVESEGMQIMHYSCYGANQLAIVRITLVINHNNLKNLMGVLEQKNYTILRSYGEIGNKEIMQDRYDNLIHYLNI